MASPRAELRSVFCEALDRKTPEKRAEYLDQACQGEPELRARIEALLRAHDEVSGFLDEPSGGLVATVDEPISERPGTVIGPYKLLEPIGEGGMGVVWMAEQQQPVRRKVALKIIKPGMDSRQVIARFEAERQALALMDHVNIARVLDAGATASGGPFFVMELIHGVPITKYCDDNQLTPRERLELFVPICQAIQHAHQKGVIHRDIKPSNVLVTLYDGQPVPKIIDFGVAKAIENPLTDRTLFTHYGTILGTFEYMSPEQAEMSALGVDTRSDIYSLGVLLYELLTGSTPLEHQRLRDAPYAEIVRWIREEEPQRPSKRLSNTATLPGVAAARKTEPAKLAKLFRGEVDWIALKALEKDRNRRYESASSLAADVRRYLHDEPVLACPPSKWYLFRKFASRNKAVLAIAAVVALAGLAAVCELTISNHLIGREEKQKSEALLAKDIALREKEAALHEARSNLEIADAHRRQAQAHLTLILAALDEIYITEAEKRSSVYRMRPQKGPGPDPRPARLERDFLQKGMGFYEKLIQLDNKQSSSQFETAKAFRRVGMLQAELQQYDKAEACLKKSISLLGKLAEEFPAQPQYRFELYNAHFLHGRVLAKADVRRLPEAVRAYGRAMTFADKLADEVPTHRDYREIPAACRVDLGYSLRALRRIPEAETEFRRALRLWERLTVDFPNDRWYRHELAYTLDSLGWLLQETAKQPEQAEPFFRRAVAYHQKLLTEDPADANEDERPPERERLARSCCCLGDVLIQQGKHVEAAETAEALVRDLPDDWESCSLAALLLEHCAELAKKDTRLPAAERQTAAKKHLDRAEELMRKAEKKGAGDPQLWSQRGAAALQRCQWDKAAAHYTKAIALTPEDWWLLHERCFVYLQLGQYDKAVADCTRGIELQPRNCDFWVRRGDAYKGLGQRDKAFADYVQAIALNPQGEGASWAWRSRGSLYADLGEWDKAAADFAKAIEWDKAQNNGAALIDLFGRGAALYRAGRHGEAIQQLDEANAAWEQAKPKPINYSPANTWFFLAMAHGQQGEKDKARHWFERAVQWMDKYMPKGKELGRFRAEAAELLKIEAKKK